MAKNEDAVVGKRVAFDYNGKRVEREITEVCEKFWDSWVGDCGFEDEQDSNSDSFLIHGNCEDGKLTMQGLCIQYDSADGTRHGYVSKVEVL